jgi:hypothetical protein
LVGVNAAENTLLDLILDQVTAREPDGVYIVVELASDEGYYPRATTTLGAMMRLVGGLKAAGVGRVIVNYATVAGLILYAIGADDWSTGWYLSERKLDLATFVEKEDEMKSAYPAYYSHGLGGEIHLKNDLDRLIDEGFIDQLEENTRYAKGLFMTLRNGQSVADVPEWRFSKGKVSFAKSHFSTVMARETMAIDRLDPSKRLAYADSWLRGASKLAQKFNSLEDLHPRTAIAHQRNWLKAFEAYADTL